MELKFNFKNFDPSDHLKNYAQTRFEKLTKYLRNSDSAKLQINLEVEKFRQKAEVILLSDELHLSAQEETQDMYSTIDLVLDKMEAQVRKLKDKQKDRRKGKSNRGEVESMLNEGGAGLESAPQVVKVDLFDPKPITVEEASIRLQESANSNNFLVFYNADANRVNVLYRRKNGDFGLIDPGM